MQDLSEVKETILFLFKQSHRPITLSLVLNIELLEWYLYFEHIV